MNNIVFDFITLFEGINDPEKLRQCFERAIIKLGFASYTYGGVRLPTVGNTDLVIQTTYSREWEERYISKGYQQNDPVVAKGLTSTLPFKWHDISNDSSKIIAEGREFGHGVGVSIPIHGPHGELALLSVCIEEESADLDKLYIERMPQLHFLAFHYHRRLTTLLSEDSEISQIHLSKREREVLTWSAKGKTAWEIGEIINISERTVNQYIQSSIKKFGVYNKHHAVVKAVIHGLIVP